MHVLLQAVCMFSSLSVFSAISTIIPPEPFVFVRHGSTDWSPETISQGPQDLPLNEKGKSEAASVADVLVSVISDDASSYVMMTSSLKRTIDTAKIIAEKTSIPIFVEQGLQERYFGDFSLEDKTHSSSSQIPADAEPEDVFQHRVCEAVRKIFADSKAKRGKKIIVSHGEVFKLISKLLTKEEKTIPREGIVMFVPVDDPNAGQSWSIRSLTEK